jgi:hypothetical protein
MQIPCTQVCEELQGIPQVPQLLGSVKISVQLLSQARRSDGQTTAFVGAGEITGVPVTGAITVVITLAGVISGRGVVIVTYEVATGVIRGVTAGDK